MIGVERPTGPMLSEAERSSARLWPLFLLIVASRLLFTFVIFPHLTGEGHILNTNPDDYDRIAHNLAHGHGYVLSPGTAPTMQRLPLYPLLLVPLLSLSGPNLWLMLVVQALIDGGSCVIVYRIAERMYQSRAVSQLAALLFAFYPGFLVAAARIATESLYTFLILLAALLFIGVRQKQAGGRLVAIGAVLGLAALCKSTALLLPAWLGAVTWCGESRARRGAAFLKTTALLFAGMLAVMSPWLVRNYLLIGRFVPTSTIGGSVVYDAFYLARDPWRSPLTSRLSFVDLSKLEQHPILSSHGIQTYSPKHPFWYFRSEDEYRADRLMYQLIAQGLWEAPSIALRFVLQNAVGFWFVAGSRAASLASFLIQLPLIIAAVIGLRRSYLEGVRAVWGLVAIIVYFNLFYTFSLGMVRYSVPIMPFVIILASKGLSTWRRRGKAAARGACERAIS